jgi:hypothetical protein
VTVGEPDSNPGIYYAHLIFFVSEHSGIPVHVPGAGRGEGRGL